MHPFQIPIEALHRFNVVRLGVGHDLSSRRGLEIPQLEKRNMARILDRLHENNCSDAPVLFHEPDHLFHHFRQLAHERFRISHK